MTRILKQSLASWRQSHGFGILNVVRATGEHFFVEVQPALTPEPGAGWVDMTEIQLRDYLATRGFSEADIDDAIGLSREWATTVAAGNR